MKLIALVFATLFAPLMLAADVDALLDQAAAVKAGDAEGWLVVRDGIVGLGADALPALQQAGADANWTSEGWVRAMAAEACRLRIESPETAAAVDKPRGLSPDEYKLFRKPEPGCQRELRNLGKAAVPLLLERWRWTFESYPFSKGAPGEAERECFARAILFVPGAVADARARHAMEEVLRAKSYSDTWRGDAAISLGQTGELEALAVLVELFDSAEQPLYVREACAWAMGRVAHIDSANALKLRIEKDGMQAELQRALINGVGILGNSWAWAARGVMRKQAGDQVRELCADILVAAISSMPQEAEYIGRALGETAWEPSLDAVANLMENAELPQVRDAAKACHTPLKTAIERNK